MCKEFKVCQNNWIHVPCSKQLWLVNEETKGEIKNLDEIFLPHSELTYNTI
jgi:hypothetical protein